MTAPADANAHAGCPDTVPPNCALGATWCRDLTEGRSLAAVLDRAAERRGRERVVAEVVAWLEAVR